MSSSEDGLTFLGFTDPEEFKSAFDKRLTEVRAVHGPPIPTISRGQVLGLGRSNTFDRLMVDLMDRDLFTVNTALDLFEIGLDMGPGQDRAGTAVAVATCFWASDEPLLAVGFGLMAAQDRGPAGEIGFKVADVISNGGPFSLIVEGYSRDRDEIIAGVESSFATTGY